MPFLAEMDPRTGFIAAGGLAGKGADLRTGYQAAKPFPHIVIDDFLPDDLIDLCVQEFPGHALEDSVRYDRDQERYKRQINPEAMSPPVRGLFYAFNSRPFIGVVENITGIKGLIPDPYFAGGGFHEIGQGGHLSVHTDFNHHKPMNLERRVNVLIYLNRDWRGEFGGQLELWSEDMARCEVSVAPLANRCVMFNTTSTSNHGNPQPVNHPAGITRKSIALYYYTATWTGDEREHTTQFKARPQSVDRFDWAVWRRELATDLTPPILMRALRRGRSRD
jgi:hypothetical protein